MFSIVWLVICSVAPIGCTNRNTFDSQEAGSFCKSYPNRFLWVCRQIPLSVKLAGWFFNLLPFFVINEKFPFDL